MKIKKIECYNFRNLNKIVVQPTSGLNLFIGDNAQGKSNLLEAVYMFISGKSYRTTKSTDVINFNSSHAEVKIDLEKKGDCHHLYLSIREDKKLLTIDGINRKKIADLLGYLNLVSFFPSDLELIGGGPRKRRDFIDLEISQVMPSYYRICQKYNRIIKQRNMLLKKSYQQNFSNAVLKSFDEQLIELGSSIIIKRLETLYKINILAKLSHRQLTKGKENLVIKYNSSIGLDDIVSKIYKVQKTEVEDLLLKKLNMLQQKELQRRTTLVGPHLDDINFIINGHDARRFGSQGQQRTTVLALKLAELQFMKSETGEMPILLLDDVLSELDKQRQLLLLELAAGHTQTFVTTTDISLLTDKIKDESFIYKVDKGNIVT